MVFGRWAAALRALVPGLAGMSGIPRRTFTVANIAGGALWAAAVAVVLGYLAGASYGLLERRLGLGGEVLLAVVALVIVARIWGGRRAARRERAAREPAKPSDGR